MQLRKISSLIKRGDPSAIRALRDYLDAFPLNRDAQTLYVSLCEFSGPKTSTVISEGEFAAIDAVLNLMNRSLFQEAIEICKHKPEIHTSWRLNILGYECALRIDLEDAGQFLDRAFRLNSFASPVLVQMANRCLSLGEYKEAHRWFSQVHPLSPYYADARINLVNCLTEQGMYRSALDECDRLLSGSVKLNSDQLMPLRFSAAVCFKYLNDFENAISIISLLKGSEQFRARALLLEAQMLQRRGENLSAERILVQLVGDYPESHQYKLGLGSFYLDQKEFVKAFLIYRDLVLAKGSDDTTKLMYLFLKAMVNDYQVSDIELSADWRVDRGSMFPALALTDDIRVLQTLVVNSKPIVGATTQRVDKTRGSCRNNRLRVGFFSNDFHDHATMYLMSGLFNHIDTNEFDVWIISWGRFDWRSDIVSRSLNDFHHLDISALDDYEAVDKIGDLKLDFAIDLKGYTEGCRPRLFYEQLASHRLAWLGYPGSLGSHYEAALGDSIVSPSDESWGFLEPIVNLECCYQPNNELQWRPDFGLNKNAFGFSEEDFIFACFNRSFKIGEDDLVVWRALLDRHPKSCLWLLQDSDLSKKNLTQWFRDAGIDASRIHFAKRMTRQAYLMRLSVCDIFLDTSIYNAHTVCSDALWCGVPVCAQLGKTFSGRVSSSLLHFSGFDELIFENRMEYVEGVSRLVDDAKYARELRHRLIDGVPKSALFDSRSFAVNFAKTLRGFY